MDKNTVQNVLMAIFALAFFDAVGWALFFLIAHLVIDLFES